MEEQSEFEFGASPLIQPEVTKAVTEDAIHRATFLSDEDRKQEMFEAIEAAARQHAYFTADEVWAVLGKVGDDERDDGSGIGPVMRAAVAAGVMKATGLFRRSQRPATHGKPLPIWKSLLRLGPDTALTVAVEVLEGKAG